MPGEDCLHCSKVFRVVVDGIPVLKWEKWMVEGQTLILIELFPLKFGHWF